MRRNTHCKGVSQCAGCESRVPFALIRGKLQVWGDCPRPGTAREGPGHLCGSGAGTYGVFFRETHRVPGRSLLVAPPKRWTVGRWERGTEP